VFYGYNFNQDTFSTSVDISKTGDKWNEFNWGVGLWGGKSNVTKLVSLKGMGDFFQFMIQNKTENQGFTFNGIELPVKPGAPTKEA
jgi:hypothetical protein